MDWAYQITLNLAIVAVAALANKILDGRRHKQTLRALRALRHEFGDHVELQDRRHRSTRKRLMHTERRIDAHDRHAEFDTRTIPLSGGATA